VLGTNEQRREMLGDGLTSASVYRVQTAKLYPDVAIGGEAGSTGVVRDA